MINVDHSAYESLPHLHMHVNDVHVLQLQSDSDFTKNSPEQKQKKIPILSNACLK